MSQENSQAQGMFINVSKIFSSDNCHLTIYRLFVDSECMPTLGESSLGIVEYASVTRSFSEVNPKEVDI